jgi:hypothetical protein
MDEIDSMKEKEHEFNKHLHDTSGSCDICGKQLHKGNKVRMFMSFNGYDEYEQMQSAEFYCMDHSLEDGWKTIRERSDRVESAEYLGLATLY